MIAINAETCEILDRELTEAEQAAQIEWKEWLAEQRKMHAYEPHRPTDFDEEVSDEEWARMNGWLDTENVCPSCHVTLAKNGECMGWCS